MKLTLGFSPCPNDTFIFDALVNKKIDTKELEFEVILEDVETLNKWAMVGKLDITKLSFPAFFQSLDKYVLMNSGSALGKGVGPLLISKYEARRAGYVDEKSIAIPGINTTANLLLSFAFPNVKKKIPMIFSAIEEAVLSGQTNFGVIIHENRFTYQQKGLHKVADLGEYWEKKMKSPVPLGGVAIKKTIDKLISLKVEKLVRKSINHAFAENPLISDYVKQHSQTISEEVMRKHIDLYVNDYSLELGKEGKQAIEKLFEIFVIMNRLQPSASSGQLFLS